MSEKFYKVKPLEWEGIKNLYFCTSDIAEYQIRKRADGGWLCLARGGWDQHADSLEAGKLACEAHWRERLAKVLEEVPSVDRLVDAAEQFIEVASLGPSTEAYDMARWELRDAIMHRRHDD